MNLSVVWKPVCYTLLTACGVSAGMAAHELRWIALSPLVKVLEQDAGRSPPGYTSRRGIPREVPEELREINIHDLIAIRQPADIEQVRAELVKILWGAPGLPQNLPASVERDVQDARYRDVASLARMDRLQIDMDYGLDSIVYHFHPRQPNNRVIVYHEGHGGDYCLGLPQIQVLLDRGYAVVALAMPLLGPNCQPWVALPRVGRLHLTNHDQMKFLAPEHGHPVQYFLEPIVVALNYLQRHYEYASIAMAGISGGGWATTMAAAIDTRISQSFPVAGSYPIFLRSIAGGDWGDYEQTAPEIYGKINYLELYVLGAAGPRRRQLQILNEFDPCCFGGNAWELYRDAVRQRVELLGTGEFELFVDASHRDHAISDAAMERILESLDAAGPTHSRH